MHAERAAVLVNPLVSLERGEVYPFVDMQSVDPGTRSVGPSEVRHFRGSGSRFCHGDTLLARITPCLENGKIARYSAHAGEGMGHGSTEFIVIRGRPSVTDNGFAYYLTKWEVVRQFCISQMTGSSGRQRVPTSALSHLEVRIPPLRDQRAVARILGALDDKIELNGQRNRTLEAMARAIFKSWFIDFDPVRANAANRTPNSLSRQLATLFPDRFENSTIGPIPAGWRVERLDSVLTVLETGTRPKGGVKDIKSGVPSVGAESIVSIGQFDFAKTKFVPDDFFLTMKRGIVESRDVLLYKDGGKPGLYEPHVSMFGDGFPFDDFCINEHVYRLRADTELNQNYLYFWLSSETALEEMRVKGTGVAIPGLNSTAVRSLSVLVPIAAILEKFDAMIEPVVAHLFSSCKESRTLAALRDALLPKLLSGEVRLKDAERFAAKVTGV